MAVERKLYDIVGNDTCVVNGEFEIDLYEFPAIPLACIKMNSDNLPDADLQNIDVEKAFKLFAYEIGLSIKHIYYEGVPPLPTFQLISRKFRQNFPIIEVNFQRQKVLKPNDPVIRNFANSGRFIYRRLELWREAYCARRKRQFETGKTIKPWPYRKGAAKEKLTEQAENRRAMKKQIVEAKKASKKSARIKLAEVEAELAKVKTENENLQIANSQLTEELNGKMKLTTNDDSAEPFRMKSMDVNVESIGANTDTELQSEDLFEQPKPRSLEKSENHLGRGKRNKKTKVR